MQMVDLPVVSGWLVLEGSVSGQGCMSCLAVTCILHHDERCESSGGLNPPLPCGPKAAQAGAIG